VILLRLAGNEFSPYTTNRNTGAVKRSNSPQFIGLALCALAYISCQRTIQSGCHSDTSTWPHLLALPIQHIANEQTLIQKNQAPFDKTLNSVRKKHRTYAKSQADSFHHIPACSEVFSPNHRVNIIALYLRFSDAVVARPIGSHKTKACYHTNTLASVSPGSEVKGMSLNKNVIKRSFDANV